MADGDDLKIVFTLTLAGGGLILDGWKRMRLRRLVEDMPTSPIQSAPQGFIEVQGEAYAFSRDVYSGLNGSPMLYVEYKAQRYVRRKKNSGWETMFECTLGERFLLRDQSGWAHVLMKGANLQLREEEYDWDLLGGDAQAHFMEKIFPRMTVNGWNQTIGDGEWRILERGIHPGETVYVLGSLKTRQNEPQYDIEVAAGKIARIAPVGGIMKQGVQPLVIADCHQPMLLQRIGNWSLARMILGAAAIALAAYFLISGA